MRNVANIFVLLGCKNICVVAVVGAHICSAWCQDAHAHNFHRIHWIINKGDSQKVSTIANLGSQYTIRNICTQPKLSRSKIPDFRTFYRHFSGYFVHVSTLIRAAVKCHSEYFLTVVNYF